MKHNMIFETDNDILELKDEIEKVFTFLDSSYYPKLSEFFKSINIKAKEIEERIRTQ